MAITDNFSACVVVLVHSYAFIQLGCEVVCALMRSGFRDTELPLSIFKLIIAVYCWSTTVTNHNQNFNVTLSIAVGADKIYAAAVWRETVESMHVELAANLCQVPAHTCLCFLPLDVYTETMEYLHW